MPMKPNKKQELTFEFLQKKEKENKSFTDKELSEASTYPLNKSLKAKLSRKEFGEFIEKVGGRRYKAKNTLKITVEEYAKRVSSKYRYQAQSKETEAVNNTFYEKMVGKKYTFRTFSFGNIQ
ncbi:MAG: hypothetical protein ABEH43_01630 [Flavobacteriales bacterium]